MDPTAAVSSVKGLHCVFARFAWVAIAGAWILFRRQNQKRQWLRPALGCGMGVTTPVSKGAQLRGI